MSKEGIFGSLASKKERGMARYLAGLVDKIKCTSFSEQDRILVRQHIVDGIAAAFFGCRGKVFDDLSKLSPKVSKGCILPGSRAKRVYFIDGGMLWAFAINASVFEDGSREGACHPGAVVIPTIIALSSNEKDWKVIDRAAIAGYEVMVRLARSCNPKSTRRGFQITSIIAPFGAAATASLLLDHDLQMTQNALSLAALGSTGLISSFKSGQTQPLQVAWSVRSGIVAALIAGSGQSGYSQIIEEGFYPAYLGSEPYPPIDMPLEHGYAIRGSYLKLYPGCRHMHPSIDALVKILEEDKIIPSQVKKIRVRTYKIAVEMEIADLKERGDAYFNIPYVLAARMVLGKNDWDTFDKKYFANKNIIEIMKKVKMDVDPEIESLYPNQRGAIVEVDMSNGKTFRRKVNHALGEPENPLPVSVTRDKFRKAAEDFLSKKSIDRIESVLDVSRLADSPAGVFEVLSNSKRSQ